MQYLFWPSLWTSTPPAATIHKQNNTQTNCSFTILFQYQLLTSSHICLSWNNGFFIFHLWMISSACVQLVIKNGDIV